MKLRKSQRKNVKIKMALQGISGSGKTYSSLLIAKGLTNGGFSKTAIIDTENGSADLYTHLGQYNVLTLKPPFTPESYTQAIDVCLKEGMEVIIIDSISHCWYELLDFHSRLVGNSFTNWNKVTPRHKAFINKMLQADAHIIATMRTKQGYILNHKDGKYIPEKVGLKAIQRDGTDYEFTLVFELNTKHFASASKDRTNLFSGKPEFIINAATGKKILNWCDEGNDTELNKVEREIDRCKTIKGLRHIFTKYSQLQEQLKPLILKKKREIENIETQIIPSSQVISEINDSKNRKNGNK